MNLKSMTFKWRSITHENITSVSAFQPNQFNKWAAKHGIENTLNILEWFVMKNVLNFMGKIQFSIVRVFWYIRKVQSQSQLQCNLMCHGGTWDISFLSNFTFLRFVGRGLSLLIIFLIYKCYFVISIQIQIHTKFFNVSFEYRILVK